MFNSAFQRCILSAKTSSYKVNSAAVFTRRCNSSIAGATWTNYNPTGMHHHNRNTNTLPLIENQQLQSSLFSSSSNKPATNTKKKLVPRKAALHLTPKARDIFRKLIEATSSEGIKLKYEMSSQHALRMAFKFDLIKDVEKELSFEDEGWVKNILLHVLFFCLF